MTMNIHDKTACQRMGTRVTKATPKGTYGARRWPAAGA
jgi:hypothetical protein